MADLAGRASELCERVLGPLVLGGAVRPVRPFGFKLARALGAEGRIDDPDLASRIDVARVRRARLYAPVDALRDLEATDWALLCALNDLLQLTNHELAGPFTRGRYRRLLANVEALCEVLPAPKTVDEALARHATFARVLDLARTDSVVSWWTGSARFRGEAPPRRLLAWSDVRRVRVDATKIGLSDMAAGVTGMTADEFNAALATWLTRSPLTDLATAGRKAPVFGWSASTLSLIATAPGRALAYRAVARQAPEAALATLMRAEREVPSKYEDARRLVASFTAEVRAGAKLGVERPA